MLRFDFRWCDLRAGEMAILNNDARKATVTAHGDLKCAKMDRARFERLLGPMENMMRRM